MRQARSAAFSQRLAGAKKVMRAKRSKAPRHYEIHADFYGKPLHWSLENSDRLQPKHRGLLAPTPWPDGYLQSLRGPWNLPEYLERPRFIIDENKGRLPRDLEEGDGVFLISAAAKAVFEALDPAACDIRPWDTFLTSGEPGPETWLCSITRAFIGAVDLERSEIHINMAGPGGLPIYGLGGGCKLRFKPEVVNGAHLFHIAESAHAVFCDEVCKQACKDAGLKGARFTSFQ